MMKKLSICLLLMMACLTSGAQNATLARKVLDKTAAVVGSKNGASANFSLTSKKYGSVTGTIAIKGNMFHATTPEAIVWYNGKTQWSYMKKTNEVNVNNPTEAQQMRMNPYKFITMYKTGYNMGITDKGSNYWVHLIAQNKSRTVQELYILVNKKSYKPSQIRMRQGSDWTDISISNFKTKKLSNSLFTFNAKDFPTAEVIDLR
ncbi:LolA-like putative outer membrane lipoprotein chaperone [Prevotella sp. KH2C16]|uniref:LolA-like putative outer membrane lipoprotein chaperone n=1 Tax=Prevotella sp. KH2C16 TaxID=1855325 RepID=UPI000B871A9C|nr:LolA-like putative outer membrane lipoprotein chaperone [Prevotella sp. KH2C16]